MACSREEDTLTFKDTPLCSILNKLMTHSDSVGVLWTGARNIEKKVEDKPPGLSHCEARLHTKKTPCKPNNQMKVCSHSKFRHFLSTCQSDCTGILRVLK